MAFSHHLRAHEEVDLASFPPANQFLMGTSTARGVSIHARYPGVWHKRLKRFFNPFGAAAHGREGWMGTLGTNIDRRVTIIAVMAGHSL